MHPAMAWTLVDVQEGVSASLEAMIGTGTRYGLHIGPLLCQPGEHTMKVIAHFTMCS